MDLLNRRDGVTHLKKNEQEACEIAESTVRSFGELSRIATISQVPCLRRAGSTLVMGMHPSVAEGYGVL